MKGTGHDRYDSRLGRAMKNQLHALIVEDAEDDASLLLLELERGGYDVSFERVQTADTMRDALLRKSWDIVLSDYSMPSFNAPAALAVLRETELDVPFIVISGTIGEEAAVAALKGGAHDFLVKGRLARLLPAIDRELRESKMRGEARLSERSLRALDTRFRSLLSSGIIGVTASNLDGTYTQANDAFLDLVGYSRSDLAAGRITSRAVTPPEEADRGALARERIVATGVLPLTETELVAKDKHRVPVMVGGALVEGGEIIGFVADISERRRAEVALRRIEDQLRQAQKMEAIGNLAGGVAHDFNNLLSVILSYSQMLAEDLGPGDPRRADLEEIAAAGNRAVELTRQLLAFGRQQILQPKIIDLNEIVSGIDKLLRRLIGADVELVTVAGRHLGRTKVDPGQVEQIIMNLVVNARDAMPAGGKITIETANVELDETYASEHPEVVAGRHVMLSVTDTGTGMDQAMQSRVFEPFFTTKETEKGTGLGLATVFGIVQQSGGSIWFQSELGRGTTFKVYFPRLDGKAGSETRESTPPPSGTFKGTETILLVEDDVAVRVLARTILTRLGYLVLEAQSGGDALLICEQHAATIDLLLTDVVMPRMSGRQLADRVAPLRPEMKVLYMSGYTNHSIVHQGVLESGVVLVQKPITPDALMRKVREVLDAQRAAPS
jgi:two-component system, cell cycle sensor histidine kinase and response regulator CckA